MRFNEKNHYSAPNAKTNSYPDATSDFYSYA